MKRLITPLLLLIACFTASNAQPTITASGPLEFCYGESVTLCVEPAYSAYLWCSGSTTQCITITEGGDYCVLVLDSQGAIDSTFMDSIITVTVHQPTPMVVQSGDTLIVTNQFESYQWFYMETGLPVPNETDSFLIDPNLACCPCCYYVEVTDTMGCSAGSYCIEFPVLLPDSCYGNVDENQSNYFDLFPNPTSSHFQLKIAENGGRNRILKVADVTGRIIHQQILNQVQNDFPITTSNWPNGVYLISVITESGHHYTERLVVQHE